MNIKDFTKEIEERLSKKINFAIKKIAKNNDIILNGIVLSDKNISAVVYIEDLFNTYNNGKTIDEVVDIAINILNSSNMSFDFTNFDNIKDKLSLRLINAEKNKEVMKSYPYKEFLDFALIVNINVKNNGVVKVDNALLNKWNKSFDEVFEIALNSTKPVIKSIAEILGTPDIEDIVCIITNENSCFGSAAMLYNNNEPLKELAEKFDNDLYIFPSSVHEIIVTPVISDDSDYLHSMVKNINNTIVSGSDYLSDNVYKYDRKTNKISIVKIGGIYE